MPREGRRKEKAMSQTALRQRSLFDEAEPAGGYRPRPAPLFQPRKIVLAKGSVSAARRRLVDGICGAYPRAEVIQQFLLAGLCRLLQRHGRPSLQETLDLLGASLFGVDVDPQAVAWTRRALLLAAWDAARTLGGEADDAGLRVPDLRRNVVCRDFLAPSCAAPDELPGKFDAILGGPPFVRIHELWRADPDRVERYRAEYRTARSGQFDLYLPFFEEAVRRLAGGWLGWSVSSTFLRTSAGRPPRALLGDHCTLHDRQLRLFRVGGAGLRV
jgi:hypothetical protein